VSAKLFALRRKDGAVAELSDEALLAACGVGETAALAALFDRYRSHVRRFISRLAGSDARDLDDLVQTTFLEIYRAARKFRGASTVRSWVFGIAVNVVRQHARGERRRKDAMQRLVSVPAATVRHADESTLGRQQLERLARALEELPDEQRVAFVMCDLEEIPGTEAAKTLGVRAGTLWRRLHQARMALRAAVKEES
jgi:RNA polymerase sigma-70 factor (ECF subfamily)